LGKLQMSRDLKKLRLYLKGIDLSMIRYLNDKFTPQFVLRRKSPDRD